MRKIDSVKFSELEMLQHKIKMAKLLLALHDNIKDGTIVDTMFMGDYGSTHNETVYEFIFEELSDFIEFTHNDDDYSTDINLVRNFLEDATNYIKRKMGI